MRCVSKTCSSANVPCGLICSRANVSCVCLRAHVPACQYASFGLINCQHLRILVGFVKYLWNSKVWHKTHLLTSFNILPTLVLNVSDKDLFKVGILENDEVICLVGLSFRCFLQFQSWHFRKWWSHMPCWSFLSLLFTICLIP